MSNDTTLGLDPNIGSGANDPAPATVTLDDVERYANPDAVENYLRDTLDDLVSHVDLLCELGTRWNAVHAAETLVARHAAEVRLNSTIGMLSRRGRALRRSVIDRFAGDVRTVIEEREVDRGNA